MSEKNQHKKVDDKNEKIEQHKKSTKSSSKAKTPQSNKNGQKTGSKDDDWNDPTGNSHLAS